MSWTAWNSTLRQRGDSDRAKARRRDKEGPQWERCHTLVCCVCAGLDYRRTLGDPNAEIPWGMVLRGLYPGEQRSEGHHETHTEDEAHIHSLRLDRMCIPMGGQGFGRCGHHAEREAKGRERFWTALKMDPDPIIELLREMVET